MFFPSLCRAKDGPSTPLRMTGAAWCSALPLLSLCLSAAAPIPGQTACRAVLPSGAQKPFHIRTTRLFPFLAGDRNPDILFAPFLRGQVGRVSGPYHLLSRLHAALR